jgi:hypothetical protein
VGEFAQGGAQQWGVVAVCTGDHASEWDPCTVGQQRPLGALFAPVHRGLPGCLAATRCLDDAAVNGHIAEVEPNDPVVGLQAQLFKTVEDTGGDPLVAPVAEGGR